LLPPTSSSTDAIRISAARHADSKDLKFNNYKKEMFLDSDTKIALISSAPSDIEQDWFLTARKKINDEASSRRVFCHMIFTPAKRLPF
jgi:uncharacterized protein